MKNLIGISGSKTEDNQLITEFAEQIGKYLSQMNQDIVTGSCPGYPLAVARSIFKERTSDIFVLGISPFSTMERHLKMGLTHNYLDYIIYTGFGENLPIPECYSSRFPTIINTSAGGIILPGSAGTFSELELYLKSNKNVAIAQGLDQSFDRKVSEILTGCQPHYKGKLLISDSPIEMVNFILGVFR